MWLLPEGRICLVKLLVWVEAFKAQLLFSFSCPYSAVSDLPGTGLWVPYIQPDTVCIRLSIWSSVQVCLRVVIAAKSSWPKGKAERCCIHHLCTVLPCSNSLAHEEGSAGLGQGSVLPKSILTLAADHPDSPEMFTS